MQIIHFDNVSLIRQGKTILDAINWEVKQGQHWAILGLNGAGKSSLLRMLTGEFWPSSGSITVLGHRFGQTDMSQLRQKIGIVSSFIAERLPSDMLAEKIVLTGAYKSSILYKAHLQSELDEALDLLKHLKAGHLIGRTYASLSQGEKQIVLVARSLMASPELLILDEATSGLDVLARETLLQQLEKISQLPHAPLCLFITHHTEEITPYISHVMLLKNGQVIAQGEKARILTEDNLYRFYEVPVTLHPIGQGRVFIHPNL